MLRYLDVEELTDVKVALRYFRFSFFSEVTRQLVFGGTIGTPPRYVRSWIKHLKREVDRSRYRPRVPFGKLGEKVANSHHLGSKMSMSGSSKLTSKAYLHADFQAFGLSLHLRMLSLMSKKIGDGIKLIRFNTDQSDRKLSEPRHWVRLADGSKCRALV